MLPIVLILKGERGVISQPATIEEVLRDYDELPLDIVGQPYDKYVSPFTGLNDQSIFGIVTKAGFELCYIKIVGRVVFIDLHRDILRKKKEYEKLLRDNLHYMEKRHGNLQHLADAIRKEFVIYGNVHPGPFICHIEVPAPIKKHSYPWSLLYCALIVVAVVLVCLVLKFFT